MICYAKLFLPVDIETIRRETLRALKNLAWMPHFNQHDYTGNWTVLPLRSPGGNSSNPLADLMSEQCFADTTLLDELPAIRQLMNSLECERFSARLLNLQAGSEIKRHRDRELSFENGEARLHFPIFTNSSTDFHVDSEKIIMQPGECWYINANLPHEARNKGNSDRIHLVVDCKVNPWLTDVFKAAEKRTKQVPRDILQQQRIIQSLRLQDTPTTHALADQLEQELNEYISNH